jgi:hypothetical protein
MIIRKWYSVYRENWARILVSFFNNLVGVFEFEVDEQGNISTKVWEWK